ncbi:MAG: hypothetical protein HYV41_02735, partial [Candidatus Magasanikbacteria bacterium]|nr:hypothetical protein [Candidatus Magasanikbacteria bacterium]
MKFKLKFQYKPSGDQPQAIAGLVSGLKKGLHNQTLLGVTGSGKSVVGDTPVFVRQDSIVRCVNIGEFIDEIIEENKEKMIRQNGTEFIDISPGTLCKVTTTCGREIVVTSDHNFFVLHKNQLQLMTSDRIGVGDYVPAPLIFKCDQSDLDFLYMPDLYPDADRLFVSIHLTTKIYLKNKKLLDKILGYQKSFHVIHSRDRISFKKFEKLK